MNNKNNSLKQLFLNHSGKVSDKWDIYLNKWDELFAPYQDLKINLLEIGIQNGGSLEVWGEYFQKANKIIGCDIDEKCRLLTYTDPRINVVVGDANKDETIINIGNLSKSFNIIIDDGSHVSEDIIESFSLYFPKLEEDGLYIIEDLHASYWKDYNGGLFYPLSSIAFLKQLVDIENYEHWRSDISRRYFLEYFFGNNKISFIESELSKIHSIEFLNSLCVIKKQSAVNNQLGKRNIVGETRLVSDEIVDQKIIVSKQIIENQNCY